MTSSHYLFTVLEDCTFYVITNQIYLRLNKFMTNNLIIQICYSQL